jgi:hypothetical protein
VGELVQGIPASPGIVFGPARVIRPPVLNVAHATVPPEQVEVEVVRFHQARESAIAHTAELRTRVSGRLGAVQGRSAPSACGCWSFARNGSTPRTPGSWIESPT